MASALVSGLGRGRVLLAGARPPSAETADRWLIRLRWLAVMGMLSTTLIAQRLVPALDVVPLLMALGGVAALNVGWMVWVHRAPNPPYVGAQIVGDVIALAGVLWCAGGVDNPFAVFLTFQIVLAGLLCSARVTLAVAGLTLLAVGVLSFAPTLPLAGAPLGEARVRHIADVMAVAALSAFSGFFVFVLGQRLQDLRRESARNEKLAILGRLVGGMSHELNTPLATILLASKELVALGAERKDDEIAQLSGTIAEEAGRAADLIGLLRGHVRPGQLRETVDLFAFVREQAGRELDRLGFRGERRLPEGGPLPQQILKAGVGHVLKNLIVNAVEAIAGESGRTTAGRIDIAIEVRGGSVDVIVRDDGPGIAPEVLERLGDPFETTKADRGGTGLGLYVCTTLTERMGGALRLEALGAGDPQPSEARGTRVTLTLPRADVA